MLTGIINFHAFRLLALMKKGQSLEHAAYLIIHTLAQKSCGYQIVKEFIQIYWQPVVTICVYGEW